MTPQELIPGQLYLLLDGASFYDKCIVQYDPYCSLKVIYKPNFQKDIPLIGSVYSYKFLVSLNTIELIEKIKEL